MVKIGNRLAEVRKAKGLSQTDLLAILQARFPGCGASLAAISRWERSKPTPALANAVMLATILETTVEDLFPLV